MVSPIKGVGGWSLPTLQRKKVGCLAPLQVSGSGLGEGRQVINQYGLVVREGFLEEDLTWVCTHFLGSRYQVA
jgi:hypothetical protein